MTDVEIVFLVLAAIYLSECVLWLPVRCLVLTGIPGRMRVAAGPDVLGNDRRRLFVLSLWPTATTLVARQPLCLVSAEAVYLEQPDQSWARLPAAELKLATVVQQQDRVSVGPHQVFAESIPAASRLVRRLQRIAASDDSDSRVQSFLHNLTDTNRVQRRVRVLQTRLQWLQQWQLMLLTWIFVAGPVLYYFGPTGWPALLRYLGLTLLLWLLTVISAWRCSRRLRIGSRRERWKDVLLSLVSPLHVVRAADRLSLGAIEDQHPLAVAAVVLPPARLQQLARQQLAELRNPLESEQQAASAAAAILPPDFLTARRQLADSLAAVLKQQGLDVDSLAVPEQRDEDAVCWCPRCFNQYTLPVQECGLCPNVATVDFENESDRSSTTD